jgi:hypothetical protein
MRFFSHPHIRPTSKQTPRNPAPARIRRSKPVSGIRQTPQKSGPNPASCCGIPEIRIRAYLKSQLRTRFAGPCKPRGKPRITPQRGPRPPRPVSRPGRQTPQYPVKPRTCQQMFMQLNRHVRGIAGFGGVKSKVEAKEDRKQTSPVTRDTEGNPPAMTIRTSTDHATATNEQLAESVRKRATRYPPRTPERRAAAALYAALADTRTLDGARRALSFTSQPLRADALALLRILEREAATRASGDRAGAGQS